MALAGADVSLICVGTPSEPSGGTDLTYVRRVLDDLRLTMKEVSPPASGFHCVVMRSTVPPGTGDFVVDPMFSAGTLPADWHVSTAMCPEFLREGSGVADFFNPPFVVVGTGDQRVQVAGGRQRQGGDVVGERPEEVALDRRECLAGQADRIRGGAQVAGDEGYVGRFDCDVRVQRDGSRLFHRLVDTESS